MIRAGLCPALPLVLALGIAAPAAAQDARLVERLYDPDSVVTIAGHTKVQAVIEFGEDEAIENVAIGDSTAWQVTPNKRANLLFIKPLEANATTNMTVVTNQRTYFFDLVASPRAKPLYTLRFIYPDPPPDMAGDEEQVAAAEPVPQASALELEAATDPYAVVDPAQLNFGWETRGDAALLPSATYDNGAATFLTWPEGEEMPAILVRDRDGTLGPVNFTVRDTTVVVDGVPGELVLRSGQRTASLIHTGARGESGARAQPPLARGE